MIDTLKRNPLLAALLLLCGALAAVILVELVSIGSSATGAQARKVAPAEAKLLPPLAAAAPEAAYPETAARPLWIPTRRPAPVQAAAAQPAFARGQFILQGVTIAGDTRIALLKEKSTGRVHRVERGRDVNGLQVAEVDAEKVTLAQGAEREVVELRVQRPAATPGAPPLAAASGGPFGTSAQRPPSAPTAFVQPAPNTAATALAPGGTMPAASANVPAVANPSPTAVPQQQSNAPMTPDELLARRRARRNLTTP